MKKMFIVSSLLALFFINTAVLAGVDQEDPAMSGANLSSNDAQNPFSTSMDNAGQPQSDVAGQSGDDSDSW